MLLPLQAAMQPASTPAPPFYAVSDFAMSLLFVIDAALFCSRGVFAAALPALSFPYRHVEGHGGLLSLPQAFLVCTWKGREVCFLCLEAFHVSAWKGGEVCFLCLGLFLFAHGRAERCALFALAFPSRCVEEAFCLGPRKGREAPEQSYTAKYNAANGNKVFFD